MRYSARESIISIIERSMNVTKKGISIGDIPRFTPKRSNSFLTGISIGSVTVYMKSANLPPIPGIHEKMARTNSRSWQSPVKSIRTLIIRYISISTNPPIKNPNGTFAPLNFT